MNSVVDSDGTINWFNIKGQQHRTDGPAIECSDGYKAWYLNGKRHRTDGPAIVQPKGVNFRYHNDVRKGRYLRSGYELWFLNGIHLTKDLFLKITKGPVKNLPMYFGLGFDEFISERIKNEFCR